MWSLQSENTAQNKHSVSFSEVSSLIKSFQRGHHLLHHFVMTWENIYKEETWLWTLSFSSDPVERFPHYRGTEQPESTTGESEIKYVMKWV